MTLQKFIRKQIRRIKYYSFSNGLSLEKVKRLRFNNQFELAEQAVAQILAHQPNNFYALAEHAQLAFDQQQFSQAAQRWEKAAQALDPYLENPSNYLLKAAEAFLANAEVTKAKTLLLPKQNLTHEIKLGLANCSLEDPEEWWKWVNAYFASKDLDEITPQADLPIGFVHLPSLPSRRIETGPKVSIIMTAYNVQDYIAIAVRSILEQSWQNLELIIVNDASTDNTPRIIEEFQQKDPRVRVIRNPINVGTYVSRNLALAQCRGEFITTHDGDDWAHPARIRIQAQNLASNPQLAGNLSRNIRMKPSGKFELTHWGTYITDRCGVSFMFRAEPVRKLFGFWDSVRISGDVELIERIYAVLGKKAILRLPHPLLITLRRENSLTTLPNTIGISGRSSIQRQQYKKAFQAWHKTLNQNNCRVSFPNTERPFSAPQEIIVPPENVLSLVKQ